MSERWNEMDDVDLMQLEAEMRGDLQEVREAALVYADRAWARGAAVTTMRPAAAGRWRGWLGWAATGVVAAALVTGGVTVLHRPGASDAQGIAGAGASTVKVQPESTVSDDALLEQIHHDLSSGVPAAMEPLEASTGTGTNTNARDAQSVAKQ